MAVLEDGVHALMHEDAPAPLTAHLPDLGYFLTSHSKTMSPSVRVGYLRAPPDAHDALARALRATLWMVSPLLAEVVTAWIEDGTADRILEVKRAEARARQEVTRDALGGFEMDAGATCHHAWLRLPGGWRAEDFVREARKEGVAVTAPSAFLAGQVTTPRAVRISLGAASTRERLREGTAALRQVLEGGPDHTRPG